MDTFQKTDTLIDANKTFLADVKKQTPYPYNLNEGQVCQLIYFFGARKLDKRASDIQSTGTMKFSLMEELALKKFYKWFRFVTDTERERKAAYRALCSRFKLIMFGLRRNPAYITWDIYNALTTCGYTNALRNVITVVDESGEKRLRLATENARPADLPPVGKLDQQFWEFQNISWDKLLMIIRNITPADIKKATLGNKSKAIRDIFSALTMAKAQSKSPNMSLTQININTNDSKEKLKGFSGYITKNRSDN